MGRGFLTVVELNDENRKIIHSERFDDVTREDEANLQNRAVDIIRSNGKNKKQYEATVGIVEGEGLELYRSRYDAKTTGFIRALREQETKSRIPLDLIEFIAEPAGKR